MPCCMIEVQTRSSTLSSADTHQGLLNGSQGLFLGNNVATSRSNGITVDSNGSRFLFGTTNYPLLFL